MRKLAVATVLAVLLISLLVTHDSRVEGFDLLRGRWLTPTTTFSVGIPGSDGLWNWNAAFERAMFRWNEATPFDFKIRRGRFEDPCDGRPTSTSQGDFENGVGFAETVCGVEFGDRVLAHASNWRVSGIYTQSNIIFNSEKDWGIYDGPYSVGRWSGIHDFRRVALHELGHSIGLGHEDDVPAIMASAATWGGDHRPANFR